MKSRKKLIILIGCLMICGVAFVISSKGTSMAQSKDTPKKVASKPLPMLVDLGADKCVPCKMMAPILEELKVTYAGKMHVVFYDVWKDSSKAREYGIRAIPTQIFCDEEGKELFRHSGYFGKEEIMETWHKLGYDFKD